MYPLPHLFTYVSLSIPGMMTFFETIIDLLLFCLFVKSHAVYLSVMACCLATQVGFSIGCRMFQQARLNVLFLHCTWTFIHFEANVNALQLNSALYHHFIVVQENICTTKPTTKVAVSTSTNSLPL